MGTEATEGPALELVVIEQISLHVVIRIVDPVVQEFNVVLLKGEQVLRVLLHSLCRHSRRVVFVKADKRLLIQIDNEMGLLPNRRNQ